MRYITKEEAKELLPIIQALVEGKMIQDKIEGQTDWVDTDEINLEFNGQKLKHRIKPESEYRPFKNVEECWSEMQKHQPIGWLKTKTSTLIYSTYEISENSDWVYRFNTYTFADGAPYGIKV